jgi:hypothetical protein
MNQADTFTLLYVKSVRQNGRKLGALMVQKQKQWCIVYFSPFDEFV